jgi:hypothetical protein
MENVMQTNRNLALRCATAVGLTLALSTTYAADDGKQPPTTAAAANGTTSQSLTGKQKATAIGAATGAVAGAVVGGPVGAVVGAGVGGVVGHEGTDAHGRVDTSSTASSGSVARVPDSTVRNAQAALNAQGYDVGTVDGQWGTNSQTAVRRFQNERGIAPSGRLDDATLGALGVNR